MFRSVYSTSVFSLIALCLCLSPGIMWPDNWLQEGPEGFSDVEVEANKYIIARPKRLLNIKTIMGYFSNAAVVLLTFGLCSPYLAMAIIASTTVTVGMWLMFLGRFTHYRVYGIPKYEDHALISLDTQVSEAIGLIKVCVWPVVNSSCLFFAFLCWDMAGDEVGVVDAIFIPCIALSMPFLIWASIRLFEWKTDQKLFNLSSKRDSDSRLVKRLTGSESILSFMKFTVELHTRPSMADSEGRDQSRPPSDENSSPTITKKNGPGRSRRAGSLVGVVNQSRNRGRTASGEAGLGGDSDVVSPLHHNVI